MIHCGGFNVTLPFAVENFRGVTRFESPMDAALAGLFYDFDTTTASKSRGPSMPPFRNAVFVHTGAITRPTRCASAVSPRRRTGKRRSPKRSR